MPGYDPNRVKPEDVTNIVVDSSTVARVGGPHIGDVKTAQPASRVGKGGPQGSDHALDNIDKSLDYHRDQNVPFSDKKPDYLDLPELHDDLGGAIRDNQDFSGPSPSVNVPGAIKNFSGNRSDDVPLSAEESPPVPEGDSSLGAQNILPGNLTGAGNVGLDDAMKIDVDGFKQAVAAGGDSGKAALANAAKAALGQMLSRMHGLVQHEADKQQSGKSFQTPIPEPDAGARTAIDGIINDPRNSGVFAELGGRVERIVGEMNDVNPATVMAAKVLETLREGKVKLQGGVKLPTLLPQEDGPARKPEKDERVLEVGGLQISVKIPKINLPNGGGVIHENEKIARQNKGIKTGFGLQEESNNLLGGSRVFKEFLKR